MIKTKTSPGNSAAPEVGGGAPKIWLQRRSVAILGVAVLSAIALGGGLLIAFKHSLLPTFLNDAGIENVTASASTDEANPLPAGANLLVMPFEEMIVNITATSETGRLTSRFMKVDLALVYDQAQDEQGLVESRHIYMRDAFQDYLRQLTDRDIEGTLGLVTLKSELLRRARAIAGSNAPHELVILGLVVQ
ncbi:flagellar basal body-associated FliL family protein [Roseinatronobacter sp.]|uniref:flagellar basal body-associated FliL family protein n=1 Tax=Roseinatronobacter sp. TaxID=1945755 RepID=UPI003F707329